MSSYGTLDRCPLAIHWSFPADYAATTTAASTSLLEERIRSAFEGAEHELGRYEKYPPRWDGYRAQQFSREVLNDAAQILRYSEYLFLSTDVQPTLVTTGPASDGSLDVELRVQDKRLLMTLYPNEQKLRVTGFYRDKYDEYLVPLRTASLASLLDWVRDARAIPLAMG